MNFSNNQENDFCQLCDKFHQQYGSVVWINVVYVALLVCIFIFACSLMFSAPLFCWGILIAFIIIWFFFGRSASFGLILVAIFLLILLFTPSIEEMTEQPTGQIVIKS
jgi:hypothetical protein|tara:strand:+ start:68 stop:391 length:324 start_codon:yes stop_codon:yes gene_type:complete